MTTNPKIIRITPGFDAGRCTGVWVSPTAPVLAAIFWNKERRDAGDRLDTEVTLWDTDAMPPRLLHRHSIHGEHHGTKHLAFEPDGQGVLFSEPPDRRQQCRLTRMDVGSGQCTVETIGGAMPVGPFIPRTRSIVVATNPPMIFDLDAGAKVLTFERKTWGQIGSIAVSPDGRYVATGHDDYYARVWDTKAGTQVRRLNKKGCSYVPTVSFSADGTRIVYGPTRDELDRGIGVSLRHVSAKWPKDELLHADVRGTLYTLAMSTCGRFVAGALHGSYSAGAEAWLLVWDVGSGHLLANFVCPIYVRLVFSADSQYLFAGTYEAAAIDIYRLRAR